MLQGSQADTRRGPAHSYSPYARPTSNQAPQYLPMRSPNNIPSFTTVSSLPQFTGAPNLGGYWAAALPSSLPNHDALSHPRIVPTSSHNDINYTSPLVPLSSAPEEMRDVDCMMNSPPLGSSLITTSQRPSEQDPYHVPPLAPAGYSASPNTTPLSAGGSSPGRRGSANNSPTSPPKKRKSGEGKLPTFLVRLYELLKEPKYPDLLAWDETGQFIVAHTSNPRLLEVLKSEYNQNRVASFTRQLNIYGWMRDNITRNTESTEPTLWRHDQLNRESSLDDLLTTVRRVAPRTSQAEKRRKQEEEELFHSGHFASMSLPTAWPPHSAPSGPSFSLGTSPPIDRSFRHRVQRNRRYSFPPGQGADFDDDFQNPHRDALQLHPPTQIMAPTNGGMMSTSAPGTAPDQFFPMPNNNRTGAALGSEVAESSFDCGILSNTGIRYLAQQGAFNRSTNIPLQFDPADADSWSRHGVSTLGQGLKPFQPAPLKLKTEIPESPIQALSNGIHTLKMPQTPPFGDLAPLPSPSHVESPPSERDSPEDTVITTPSPPPPTAQPTLSTASATVVPGSYMAPNMCRSNTAPLSLSWTSNSSRHSLPSPPSVTRAEVLAPRSSSVLQRVMHGQSGLSFVAEEDSEPPLPSARIPQPRLFDDFEGNKV